MECSQISPWSFSTTRKKNTLPPKFEGFQFTGKIRPGIISPQVTVSNSIPQPDYAIFGEPISEKEGRSAHVIEVKTKEDIEGLRKVCKMAREVLDTASQYAKPGVKTDDIDKIVHKATIDKGAYPSPLNYRGYPKSVCTSINESCMSWNSRQ